ncbi:MAG TPA: type I secretion C-terminal target domain-containing protein, partial [Hyphomicrobiaceae bacterium]|nr:type I secretion C-terminal target domain-containing protein [Hyphomicrobiaceae bacterium]
QQRNGFSAGNDTFVWEREDIGTGLDRIRDFMVGDRLDFSSLFCGRDAASSMLRVTDTAAGTIVSADMGDAGFVDVVLLEGVHLDLDALLSNACVIN